MKPVFRICVLLVGQQLKFLMKPVFRVCILLIGQQLKVQSDRLIIKSCYIV